MTIDITKVITPEDAMEGARYATALHMLRELNDSHDSLLAIVPNCVNGVDVWDVVDVFMFEDSVEYPQAVLSRDVDPLNAVFNAGRST